jgi:hypothetical protein
MCKADKQFRSPHERLMDADEMADHGDGAGSERRRHRRFPVEGFAEVIAFRAKGLFRGRLKDISESGCFIETRAHLNLPRLAEVEIRITAPGIKLSVLGRVMDVRPGKGAGFEFLRGDPRLDHSFHNMIERLHALEPAKV